VSIVSSLFCVGANEERDMRERMGLGAMKPIGKFKKALPASSNKFEALPHFHYVLFYDAFGRSLDIRGRFKEQAIPLVFTFRMTDHIL
jgi:hypothetical protein